MMNQTPIVNDSMDLAECRDKWTLDEVHACWCLEDVLYTPVPKDARFQRLSIFAPRELMNPDGTPTEAAKSAPVIFVNSAAGYAQMPHLWLEHQRCNAAQYLQRGWVYVTCGCRGRETRDSDGTLAGKAPATLVDFKTALRFLRHNRASLPGDWDKIISVGTSAGGAMSTLLGVTGDNSNFLPYLEENGAFLDQSDAVFASQIYCPIIDLEHADMAYEWMFRADKESENSPAGPAEIMTPFKEALSAQLADRFVDYFNALGLKHPVTGQPLRLNEDGRSGSGYDYLMDCLNRSATRYLGKLQQGKLDADYTVDDYLSGRYTYLTRGEFPRPTGGAPKGPRPSMGEMNLRPPKGQPFVQKAPPMVPAQGRDKRAWLTWDGKQAQVSDLDTYVLNHRRRMKSCSAFDALTNSSAENEAFGSPQTDFSHFAPSLAQSVDALKEAFPEDYAKYHDELTAAGSDAELARRVWLYNPLNYIGTDQVSRQAAHYRIRVGSCDADTSFMIALVLSLKLANAGIGSVDYALVWDQPHCDADYPDEFCDWVETICQTSSSEG